MLLPLKWNLRWCVEGIEGSWDLRGGADRRIELYRREGFTYLCTSLLGTGSNTFYRPSHLVKKFLKMSSKPCSKNGSGETSTDDIWLFKDYYIDGQNTQLIFLKKWPLRGWKCHLKLHPAGGFFEPWSFIILKNSGQDLPNEGSNFILRSLEVGHWAAQTQAFFDKIPEITDFGLLQQPQNRARFWICKVMT